jgi:hypothetical protein
MINKIKNLLKNNNKKQKNKSDKRNKLLNTLLSNNSLYLKNKNLILCVIDNRIHIIQPISLNDLEEILDEEVDFLINTEIEYISEEI